MRQDKVTRSAVGALFSLYHTAFCMDFASSPRFFRRGPKPLTRFLLCSVLSLTLLVGDARFGWLTPLREAGSVLLYPLQWLIRTPQALARRAEDFLTIQTDLVAQNHALQNRLLIAEARLQRQTDLQRENQTLRELSQLRLQPPQTSLLAEVLYTSRDPFTYKLIIDKGVQEGMKEGFPVVDARGLVGQGTRVQPLTAEVTLLIERNHPVPVFIQRTGLRAVVFGTGGGVEVRYLAAHADVQAGDLLVTSGIDGIYPAGLPVARVTRAEKDAGSPFVRVVCEPMAWIEHHRALLVLNEKAALPPRPEPAPVIVVKSRRNKSTSEE